MNYVLYKAAIGWNRGWSMFWSPFTGLIKSIRTYHKEQAEERRRGI